MFFRIKINSQLWNLHSYIGIGTWTRGWLPVRKSEFFIWIPGFDIQLWFDSSFLLMWSLGGSHDSSSDCAPATHMEDLVSVPSSQLPPNSVLTIVCIEGVNQRMGTLSLTVCLSLPGSHGWLGIHSEKENEEHYHGPQERHSIQLLGKVQAGKIRGLK